MVFVLLAILLALLLLTFRFKNLNYWNKRGIVQINANAWHFLLGKCALSEIYKKIYDNHPLENAIGAFVGYKPVLILKNLENIQALLQSEFQSFYARGYHRNPNDTLSDNLLLIDDYSRWRLVRHNVSPVFTGLKLKNMFHTLERCASDFVEYIATKKHASDDFFEALQTYISASMSATVFGMKSQSENTMVCPILDNVWNSAESLVVFNMKFALSNFFPKLYNFLNLKTFGENKQFIVELTKKVLNSRREHKDKRHDFIDTCLKLQCQGILEDCATGFQLIPTDEILAAQIYSFFVAGVDTTATAMNFTLLELSNNPKILKRLHDEIDEVFDNSQGKITYEAIHKMTYLEMVINESMRKYPPIGLMQRMCVKDTILPIGDIKIEKNILVVVPIYALHRDKKYFPDPELFDPERFSPENISNIVKSAYMPFSEGNRACIGGRFAQLQLKTGLAWLLRKYTLRGHNYIPETFEPSFFNIRHSKAHYDLIPRNETLIFRE